MSTGYMARTPLKKASLLDLWVRHGISITPLQFSNGDPPNPDLILTNPSDGRTRVIALVNNEHGETVEYFERYGTDDSILRKIADHFGVSLYPAEAKQLSKTQWGYFPLSDEPAYLPPRLIVDNEGEWEADQRQQEEDRLLWEQILEDQFEENEMREAAAYWYHDPKAKAAADRK